MPKSFRAYVQNATVTDDPEGDFVRDAKADRGLPDAQSWAELRDYLKTRGAVRNAIKAALHVWQAYESDGVARPSPPV